MSKINPINRLWAQASKAVLSICKRIKPRLLAIVSRDAEDRPSDAVPNSDPVPSEPTPMQLIMDRRAGLEAQIEAAAKWGGLALSLLANHEDELAERRQLLTDLEHQLQASLRVRD